jgi:hypothetical protein
MYNEPIWNTSALLLSIEDFLARQSAALIFLHMLQHVLDLSFVESQSLGLLFELLRSSHTDEVSVELGGHMRHLQQLRCAWTNAEFTGQLLVSLKSVLLVIAARGKCAQSFIRSQTRVTALD